MTDIFYAKISISCFLATHSSKQELQSFSIDKVTTFYLSLRGLRPWMRLNSYKGSTPPTNPFPRDFDWTNPFNSFYPLQLQQFLFRGAEYFLAVGRKTLLSRIISAGGRAPRGGARAGSGGIHTLPGLDDRGGVIRLPVKYR